MDLCLKLSLNCIRRNTTGVPTLRRMKIIVKTINLLLIVLNIIQPSTLFHELTCVNYCLFELRDLIYLNILKLTKKILFKSSGKYESVIKIPVKMMYGPCPENVPLRQKSRTFV
jgi:hypothetical protein